MWQKTGCLITADGSDDSLIKPEGLKSYVVPPPAFLPPTVGLPQVEELPVTAADPTEDHTEYEDAAKEQPADKTVTKLEDRVEDRDYQDDLVGRNVTALYENGWFTGNVVYFNKELQEFRVEYADGTSDYLATDDFDGVEVILEPDSRQ